MFTGLVTDLGEIASISTRGDGAKLSVKTNYDTADLEIGESIAVDGACLTVTEIADNAFSVEASLETLRRTTLGDRLAADQVHLERALRFSDRLGGHLVLGHVDGVGEVTSVGREGNAVIVTISAGPEVSPFLLPKGSITVDGVSLTLNRVGDHDFDIALIPHTQEKTKAAHYAVGTRVNLEADVIGKYVRRMLDGRGSSAGIDLETLSKAGFVQEST